ncbi:MAG: beta-N-acetylhexosaminidase [Acidobacteriota bacterium]
MALLLILCLAASAAAQNVTELWAKGYSVIPTPRNVRLARGEAVVDGSWSIDASAIRQGHIAARTLAQDLASFHQLTLGTGGAKVIRLTVAPGTVATHAEAALDQQAYRLTISDARIEIAGNGDAGLFYGVQTLLQLLKRDAAGRLAAPVGTIEDWPKLQLRFLHWDTKHHQNRMETVKRYLDWSARMKVNMIGFELEDKFEYPSHPVIGAPGAYTAAELQEIVNYGLERFIQVVPVIQSPAHMSYVLKHPEFAHLRADGSNYQSALCDPRTYDLIFSMYDDVIKATRGVDYLFVSTDEVYYAGIEGTCRPYNPENRSLAWVEFVRRARDFAHSRGRRILVWAEYPLLPKHVSMIPPDVIDGVMGEEDYLEAEKKLGMRQLFYVSLQGEEKLFPSDGRVAGAMNSIANGLAWKANPIGVFGAAWDDSGLHCETFWLGWSAVAQAGWNPGVVTADQQTAEFMRFYYGPRGTGMADVYRMMQRQARAWERTWDRVPSRVRGPAYGNHRAKGEGTEREDMTLSAPALPSLPDLKVTPVVREKYAQFLAEAKTLAAENDELLIALQSNFALVDRNRYNLEVFLALAKLMGHHWRLLTAMGEAEGALEQAQAEAAKDSREALVRLKAAQEAIARVRTDGEAVYANLTAVFEKARFPKNRTVGGRKFVYIQDDVKDHWADRTLDLGYMMAPEWSIGLDQWEKALGQVIEGYARANKL